MVGYLGSGDLIPQITKRLTGATHARAHGAHYTHTDRHVALLSISSTNRPPSTGPMIHHRHRLLPWTLHNDDSLAAGACVDKIIDLCNTVRPH